VKAQSSEKTFEPELGRELESELVFHWMLRLGLPLELAKRSLEAWVWEKAVKSGYSYRRRRLLCRQLRLSRLRLLQ